MLVNRKAMSWMIGGSISAFLISTPAWAQADVTAAAAAQDKTDIQGIDDIIVTARKRSESIQDTPVAVTAITGDALQQQGVVNLAEVAGVPNVTITGTGSPGRAKISIRGVSFTNADPFQAPPIALVVDGVYYDSLSAGIINAFDLESIEILRGPQGTLFGRNSPGGAINVRSRRPGDVFDANAELSLGSYGLVDVRLGADIPIVEGALNARLAVLRRQSSDSPYTNLATALVRIPTVSGRPSEEVSRLQDRVENRLGGGEVDIWNIRGVLEFQPNDWLQMTLIGDYLKDDSTSVPRKGTSESPTPAAQLTPPGLPGGNDPYVGVNDASASNPLRARTVSLEIKADLTDELSLTSISAYRDEKVFNNFDIDGEIGAFLHSTQLWDVKQYTNETRLQSDFDGIFNFTLGGFYLASDLEKLQESFLSRDGLCLASFGTTAPGPPPARCPIGGFAPNGSGGFTGPFSPFAVNFNQTVQKTDGWAAFGQAYINLSKRLRLTLGGRYSSERKSFDVLVYAGQEAGGRVDTSDRWKDFSPMASVDYRVNDDVLLYATASRAFRAGGFNGRASTLASWRVPFDEETVTAYETGFKADLFDRRVRLNVAGFWSIYKDIQRETQVLVVGVGPENLVLNAAKATIKGIEVEMVARPSQQLNIRANLAYQDASYDAFTPVLRPDQISAEDDIAQYISFPLPLTPKWTAMLGGDYTIPLSSGGELNFGTTANYTSRQTLGTVPISNGTNIRDKVILVDAYASWQSSDERWGVRLWVKNLTDQAYVLDGNFGGGIATSATYSMPRTVGATLSFRLR